MKPNINDIIKQKKLQYYLICYYINPDGYKPDFYNVMFYGDETISVMRKRKHLFFEDKKMLKTVLSLSEPALEDIDSLERGYDANVMFGKTIHLLSKGSIDHSCTAINCINLFDDLLHDAKISISQKTKKVLYPIADQLTFNRRYGHFLKEKKIGRRELIDILQLFFNQILKRAMFVTSEHGKLIYYTKYFDGKYVLNE